MTVQELINRSLTLIGRLGQGRTPGISESAVAFGAINALLASWSTDRRSVFTVARAQYLLVAGTNAYTIGPGGGFNTARPIHISSANIVATLEGQTAKFPLDILNQVEFAAIPVATDSSVLPRKLYNDYASPISNLYLYPTPSTATHLELYTWVTLAQFTLLSDSVTFPPGYERAIVYNLAIELAPLFERPVPPEVVAIAKQAKDNIDALNVGMTADAPAKAA